MSTDRESVKCPFCGSDPGQACEFPTGPAPLVDDGSRRVVHAARYAETLPPDERGPFWDGAIDKYLATELAAMGQAETHDPTGHCPATGPADTEEGATTR